MACKTYPVKQHPGKKGATVTSPAPMLEPSAWTKAGSTTGARVKAVKQYGGGK